MHVSYMLHDVNETQVVLFKPSKGRRTITGAAAGSGCNLVACNQDREAKCGRQCSVQQAATTTRQNERQCMEYSSGPPHPPPDLKTHA